MARLDKVELARRGRRAYELGRLRMAARVLYVLPPIALIGWLAGATRVSLVCVLGVLASVAIFLRWRGGAGGPAVYPGLLVGLIPLLLIPMARSLGIGFDAEDGDGLHLIIAVGLVSGLIIGWYAIEDSAAVLVRLGTASVIASMTACISCVGLGAWAVLGIATAICAGSGLSGLVLYAVLDHRSPPTGR